MIIRTLDFGPLLGILDRTMRNGLGAAKYGKIRKEFKANMKALSEANLEIYQVNMKALDFRRNGYPNLAVYSKLEWRARQGCEKRVNSKSNLNLLLNGLFPAKSNSAPVKNWMSDDVVFSVAESIDRIMIEQIKRTDYAAHLKKAPAAERAKWENKIDLSTRWGKTVEDFLQKKLKEIVRKNYYECVRETRTFNLTGIKK